MVHSTYGLIQANCEEGKRNLAWEAMGNTTAGSRIQWQSKDEEGGIGRKQETCVTCINQLLFTSYHSTFARLVSSSQFRSGWQRKCRIVMPESLFPLKYVYRLEVVFTQTSKRGWKKQLEKRLISPQKIHINEHFLKTCSFFSFDQDETPEQLARAAI